MPISVSIKVIKANVTTTEVSLFFVLLGINLGRFIFEQTLRFVESLVLSESQCGFRSLVEEAHCGLGFKFEAATGDITR